jgi:hypothetical protein
MSGELRPSGDMTAELKTKVARAIIASCRRNGASEADIGVILTLAIFEHLDHLVATFNTPPDAILDGLIFAAKLRKSGESHNNNPLDASVIGSRH